MNIQIPDRYALIPLAVLIYGCFISLAAYTMQVSCFNLATGRGEITTVHAKIEENTSQVNSPMLPDMETPLIAAVGSNSQTDEVINYLIKNAAIIEAKQIDVKGTSKSPGG